MRYFVYIFFLFFTACSLKINPAEFHKVNAPKAKYLPSQNELQSQKVLILNVTSDDPKGAFLIPEYKNLIESLISQTSAVLVRRNKKTTLQEEILYSQEAELSSSNIDNANYIITAKIVSTNYHYTYHKGYYWKDKKGHTHYSPPYYSYEACVGAQMKIIKIPQNYIVKTLYLNGCAYDTSRNLVNLSRMLLEKALIEAVDSIKTDIKNIFAKKGYIIEIRKKDDTTIIKTTLGKKDGLKEGDEVAIYTIKESPNPLTGKPYKEIIKIGNAEVSNVIHENASWLVVKDQKEPVKLGDFVKPVYEKSFFERLFE